MESSVVYNSFPIVKYCYLQSQTLPQKISGEKPDTCMHIWPHGVYSMRPYMHACVRIQWLLENLDILLLPTAPRKCQLHVHMPTVAIKVETCRDFQGQGWPVLPFQPIWKSALKSARTDTLFLTYGYMGTQIARSMGPTWGPSGADRTQVGPMLAPWTLLSGDVYAVMFILLCMAQLVLEHVHCCNIQADTSMDICVCWQQKNYESSSTGTALYLLWYGALWCLSNKCQQMYHPSCRYSKVDPAKSASRPTMAWD